MRVDIRLIDGRIRVKTPYSPVIVARFKTIPGAYCHYKEDKSWSFPAIRDIVLMVCDVCGLIPAMLPPEIRKMADGMLPEPPPPLDMSLTLGHEFLVQPFEHQRRNLARLLGYPRWLLADEQGTAKTFAVVNRFLAMIRRREIHLDELDILVICPKSVIQTWQDELMTYGGLGCLPITGDPAQRRHAITVRPHLIKVTNYECVLHSIDDFLKVPWTVVVLDEIHRIKNFTAQSSRAVRLLTEKASYVWGLSGTPAPNGLEDWHGVLAAIDPTTLDCPTRKSFKERYLIMGRVGEDALGQGGRIAVQGYRNVHHLHSCITRVTSRVTKAECLDLPEKIFSTRHVSLEGEQARIYKEARKDGVARLVSAKAEGQLTIRNVITEGLRLLQIVGGFVPDDSGHVHELPQKCRVGALEEVLDEVGDRQVVVWCQFVAEVEWLASWLLAYDRGCKVSTLTGSMDAAARTRGIEMFRRGESRFFVATAAAGGTGLNGLQVADTEVYYSRGYNLADYLQSQDRLHRLGQKNTVSVIKILARNTVDCRIDESLDAKRDLQDMMLGNPEEML